MGKWRILAILCALAISCPEIVVRDVWAAPADEVKPTEIRKLRGKTIVLYETATSKKFKKKKSKEIKPPLMILEAGVQNNRYPVKIDGNIVWIIKAQVKETDVGGANITAKCQTITKAQASSRGLGNCQ